MLKSFLFSMLVILFLFVGACGKKAPEVDPDRKGFTWPSKKNVQLPTLSLGDGFTYDPNAPWCSLSEELAPDAKQHAEEEQLYNVAEKMGMLKVKKTQTALTATSLAFDRGVSGRFILGNRMNWNALWSRRTLSELQWALGVVEALEEFESRSRESKWSLSLDVPQFMQFEWIAKNYGKYGDLQWKRNMWETAFFWMR